MCQVLSPTYGLESVLGLELIFFFATFLCNRTRGFHADAFERYTLLTGEGLPSQ